MNRRGIARTFTTWLGSGRSPIAGERETASDDVRQVGSAEGYEKAPRADRLPCPLEGPVVRDTVLEAVEEGSVRVKRLNSPSVTAADDGLPSLEILRDPLRQGASSPLTADPPIGVMRANITSVIPTDGI